MKKMKRTFIAIWIVFALSYLVGCAFLMDWVRHEYPSFISFALLGSVVGFFVIKHYTFKLFKIDEFPRT